MAEEEGKGKGKGKDVVNDNRKYFAFTIVAIS